jgi:hypothetical protein
MPNWCHNTIRIKANSHDQLKAFLFSLEGPSTGSYYPNEMDVWYYNSQQRIDGDPFLDADGLFQLWREYKQNVPIGFHHLIPAPDEELRKGSLRGSRDKYQKKGYLSWADEHWGTKWSAKNIEQERISETETLFHFSSAWSPPIPIFEEICRIVRDDKQFLSIDLRLEYCEILGVGFCGYCEQLFDSTSGEFITHEQHDKIETSEENPYEPIGPDYFMSGGGYGVYALNPQTESPR